MLLQSNGECYWKTQNKGYNILRLQSFYIPMSLDLDSFDDDDLDEWCNDVGNCGMPPPKKRFEVIPASMNGATDHIVESVQRSLDEILEIEVKLIQDNTEFTPEKWIDIFAARFRSIMDEDSSGTISQIKRKLYIND